MDLGQAVQADLQTVHTNFRQQIRCSLVDYGAICDDLRPIRNTMRVAKSQEGVRQPLDNRERKQRLPT